MTAACCLVPCGVDPRAPIRASPGPPALFVRSAGARRDASPPANQPLVLHGHAEGRLTLARRLLDDYIARQPPAPRPHRITTGLPSLDEVFGGGLPLGALCQVGSTTTGAGALSLALRLACAAADRSRFIFLIDSAGCFYPPAAVQCGLNLDRLVIVRHARPSQALWAAEQVLRCSAAGAVIGLWPRLDERASRRLQLAAEAGGGVGLLVSGAGRMSPTPFAAAHLMVEPWVVSEENPTLALPLLREGNRRLVRIHLSLRRRAPTCLVVDLHHASGHVPLYAVPGDRPGRAPLRAIG